MTRLWLDWETKSEVDLGDRGIDVYFHDPSTAPLMLGWAVDDDAPTVWQPHVDGPELPSPVVDLVTAAGVQKLGWNCAFERLGLRHFFGLESPIDQWLDPSTLARYASIGGSLQQASEFLGLGDEGKDKRGKALIRLFCQPRKATKKLPAGWNTAETHPKEWDEFVSYCRQDVVAERAVLHRLEGFFSLPEQERRVWELDAKINERGLPVDTLFVSNARHLVDTERERLLSELQALTGLDNCNSNAQLLKWLKSQGYPFSSLGAAKVGAALEVAHGESVSV